MKDFQYKNEEVQDWATHLNYLQSIFLKFNVKRAHNKDNLICHFYKGLKPSIPSQIEQMDGKLDNWKVLIRKAIATKSKIGLYFNYVIQDMDSYYLHGNWPAHSTIAQVQT